MRLNDVKAIVLTGSGGRFSASFDINIFKKVHESGDVLVMPDVSADFVLNTLEGSKSLLLLPSNDLH
ncbi:hypothetical protein ACFX15_045789 [Malus domestica]